MMEYTKRNLCLPGHAEQWNIIHNLNGLSIGDLPKKELSSVIEVTQLNYMYVLFKAWAVNCTRF